MSEVKTDRGHSIPQWLGLFQDGFVVWVILGALWGYLWPELAGAGKSWIPQALGAVMLGMGLTLARDDIHGLRLAGKPLLLGVILQYLVMPLGAWLIASVLGLPKILAVGVILVGASPGGTASNVITFLAKGDVTLSVAMTTTSTLLSPLLTPLWIWLLAMTWLSVDPIPLFWAITQVVLLPVVVGIVMRRFWIPGPWFLEGILPIFSIAIIAWIVGVVVGLNHDWMDGGDLGWVAIAVVAHNALGLLLGYQGSRYIGLPRARCRTVSIEVGMQNSGLAVALAVAHFDPAAALPGAVFSVWHNVTGPVLAAIWRRKHDRHEINGR